MTHDSMPDPTPDPTALPADLPEPVDDGAARHLRGTVVPAIALPATSGGSMRVDRVPEGYTRLIIYAYPRTARPKEPSPPGWDQIPGARGCTPESCGFRDHAAELAAAGAVVAGVSTQDTADQREAAERLRLPFPLLSDGELRLATALALPTFEVDGHGVMLRRLTLVVTAGGVIEHVFYPVFPPDEHAERVLAWLRAG